MELLEKISRWTETLNPIVQGLIGSAIFSVAVWLGRKFWTGAISFSKTLKSARDRDEIIKIIIHKHYINRNGMYYFTQGYLLVIYNALFNLFKGLIFYFSSLAIADIIPIPFIKLIGLYFCVQELLSGLSWINPKWIDKSTDKYDQNLVKEIKERLMSSDALRGDENKGIK